MIAWLISQLERGQELIKGAPGLVIALLIVGFLVGRYFLHERMNVLEERLKAKDEQIAEYRQRLHLAPVGQTSYSRLTNAELKQVALRVISGAREFFIREDEEQRRILFAKQSAMIAAKSEDERRQIWNRQTDEITQTFFQQISDYDGKFKVDTILLRDELLARLPKEARNDRVYRRYEHPVNPLGMKEVIDDLERMAKLLPS